MSNLGLYIKKIPYILVKKPGRIIPHLKSRLMYATSGLSMGYANFPHTIYLGISNRCNLKCKMCDLGQEAGSLYRKNLSPSRELSFNQWKVFIDEVALHNPTIELSAAEPLLYKDFIPLVRYIKQVKGLECRIFTNAYLLEENSQFLKEVDIDHIIVSIDGPPDTHDFIRGKPGLFDKVMRGLLSIKSDARIKRPFIDINYTISQYNYGKIEDMFNILNERGVIFDRFTIIQTLSIAKGAADKHNRIYPGFPVSAICETGVDFCSIDIRVLQEQMDKLIKSHPQKVRIYPDFHPAKLNEWYNSPEELVGNRGCQFIWNSANLTSDGELIPYMRCVNKSFGNITKDSFKEIWNNGPFREFRLLSKRVVCFPICARCSASFMK